jgi:uncharacterized protein YbaP (TraB family)
MQKISFPRFAFFLTFGLIFLSCSLLEAQSKKNYQGLFWQISGKGMSRPSYLYGTMHVSGKVAFHLSDSFYIAISSVDVVALETNPEHLMDDLMEADYLNPAAKNIFPLGQNNGFNGEEFQLVQNQKEGFKAALSEELSLINGLLFRTNDQSGNFEEDTYLDLYIYKTGKRLKKQIAGVELFKDVTRLSEEAYKVKDNEIYSRKRLSPGEAESLMNDAYRRGDLDFLDSLHQISSSKGYLEKMLYERNRTMAKNMDSIIQKNPLFVGVGAAHLPGVNGIIELLRKKGYTVRPVKIGDRDSKQKAIIDKKKYALAYTKQNSSDKFFQVDVPGKLYELGPNENTQYYLYPELVNGAFYMVTRIKTYAPFVGKNEKDILNELDSMLYESIPGEIISKQVVNKNGYQGLDIVNKTRRGDFQRCQIYSTPFELIIFKLGGTRDFAKSKDADLYFNSIQLKENKPKTEWANFEPDGKGFQIQFPNPPVHNFNFSKMTLAPHQRHDFLANDGQNTYLLSRVSAARYDYIEEDTFDLSMVAEGFATTAKYKEISRKNLLINGLEVLDVNYETTNKQFIFTRQMVRASHYYLLAILSPDKNVNTNKFFDSFSFKAFEYSTLEQCKDTNLFFQVQSYVKPSKSTSGDMAWMRSFSREEHKEYMPFERNKLFYDSKTGEEITVKLEKFHKYTLIKDSSAFWKAEIEDLCSAEEMQIVEKKFTNGKDWVECSFQLQDTNSQRAIICKLILKGGALYTLQTMRNLQEKNSVFVQTFFDTFAPSDTFLGTSIFADKSAEFLKNLMSKDSASKEEAIASIEEITFSEKYTDSLMHTIQHFSKVERKNEGKYREVENEYLSLKAELISKYYDLPSEKSVNLLQNLYAQVSDTTTLQLAVLEALARIKTAKSYAALKEVLLSETPLPSQENDLNGLFSALENDSLALTATLFPEILALVSLDEYEENVYSLLVTCLDSGFLSPSIYQSYQTTILNNARIALKRQFSDEQQNSFHGNSELETYTALLLPFLETTPAIKVHLEKLMRTKSNVLKMRTALSLLNVKIEVADSVWENLAKKDRFRIDLYESLKKAGHLEKFPKARLTQESIARALFVSELPSWSGSNLDSLTFLKKVLLTIKGKEGYAYFYKYRLKDAQEYKIGMSGLQPKEEDMYNTENQYFVNTGRVLEKEETVAELMNDMLKKAKRKARRKQHYMREETYNY